MMTAANQENPDALWQRFLESVQATLSSHVLETWLKPVHCTSFTAGQVTLEVRDQFSRDWLNDHYIDFIHEGLTTQAGQPVRVVWHINPNMQSRSNAYAPAPSNILAYDDVLTPATHVVQAPTPQKRKSKSKKAPPKVAEEAQATTAEYVAHQHDQQLNKRYLFDNFVAGPSNQFAFAACRAVADNPGLSYNPLFLFGEVGLGKTHLLNAIGHAILHDKPDARITYASSEQFTNEVINAVLGSKLDDFRNKYRSHCDVLLIDDIQLIAGKERTQHEFFHVFNTLYDSQRQIVVTSDKLPHEIPEIEERLRNRFQWGLIADIQPPEIETRVAILRKKAIAEDLTLPDEVAFFLAKNIRSNVRELEGALVRIMAHASLTSTKITIEYVCNILSDILSQQVSVESIQKVVARYFQIRVADLKSHRRLKMLVRPRQIAMYLCRKHTKSSFPELGSHFGDKDHTTIMSAYHRIDQLIHNDANVRELLVDIERQLDISCQN